MNRPSLQKKTLVAGVLVGVVGFVLLLSPYPLLDAVYQDARVPNTLYHSWAALVSAVTSFCLPFGAVLVGASLVMRHAEQVTQRAQRAVRAADRNTGP